MIDISDFLEVYVAIYEHFQHIYVHHNPALYNLHSVENKTDVITLNFTASD